MADSEESATAEAGAAGGAATDSDETPPVTAAGGGLRSTILDLVHRISDLVDGAHAPVEDLELSHSLAHANKPYIDRLVSLRQLLNPVDRIIDRREQIQELQVELAHDLAEVEDLSGSISDVDPGLINQLQGEITAVKKDRKLYVSEDEEDDEEPDEPATHGGQAKLIDLPVAERMRLILGSRFIDTDRLGQILGQPLDEEQLAVAAQKLEGVWTHLFERPQLRPHVRANRVRALRQAFRDYALLYRCAELSAGEACTMAALKQRFPSSFMTRSEKTLWYARLPFFQEPIAKPHWCLVDRQYLNCTFKKPGMRLMMYARANELSPGLLRQKSAVEEVYDRLVMKHALEQDGFFENCNSITRTTYHNEGDRSKKQVYLYDKGGTIRISGKQGIPHWRPGKARWPGVLVSVVFDAH